MTTYPLELVELPLSLSCRMGITETHTPENDVKAERNWNGNIVLFQSPWASRKAKISLSASGKAIRNEPAFDAATIGMTITLNSGKTRTNIIAPGATSVTLPYLVVPGSTVVCRLTSGGPIIPCTVSTVGGVSVITLAAAPASQVSVFYRPQISTMLLRWTGAAQINDGLQTWTAELAEQ